MLYFAEKPGMKVYSSNTLKMKKEKLDDYMQSDTRNGENSFLGINGDAETTKASSKSKHSLGKIIGNTNLTVSNVSTTKMKIRISSTSVGSEDTPPPPSSRVVTHGKRLLEDIVDKSSAKVISDIKVRKTGVNKTPHSAGASSQMSVADTGDTQRSEASDADASFVSLVFILISLSRLCSLFDPVELDCPLCAQTANHNQIVILNPVSLILFVFVCIIQVILILINHVSGAPIPNPIVIMYLPNPNLMFV